MADESKQMIVNTSQLRAGDVVITHGMRVLLSGEPDMASSRNSGVTRTVYGWAGRVTNLEEVKTQDIVPLGWLYPDKWGAGEDGGWGKDWDAEPSWRIQGNDLATWLIERNETEEK
ncbi:hypothetical protein [Streptomyces afghaniensis]|uniref:hypothetical protein n=1 Tax=Streptomyces afghaniensis TaxID=66865 RepID=UPI00278258EE|nr:hypothetical protein [Streptomyces afghaniensis]MDQ1016714.1 hypothetical protein [Streptomyces afghaniensis]